MDLRGGNFIGILFYGANGYMVVEGQRVAK